MGQNGGNQDGGKRSERRMAKYSQRKKWYKRPLFWALSVVLPLVLVAAAAAVALQLNNKSTAAEEPQPAQTVSAEAGMADPAGVEAPPLSSVEEAVKTMSLEAKIGQMMIVGFDGYGADATVASAIQELHIGGILIFERNIQSPEQVAALNASLQTLAVQSNHPAKLLIATDQEGGSTRRFKNIGPFYSQPMIGEMNDAAATTALQQSSSAARDLKKIGINTNLAPVLDISSGWGSYLDGRSYGTDAAFVAELGAKAVKGYNNATTIACAKHFPGLGSADADSEKSLPTVDLDRAQLESGDLLPFAEAIKEGVPMLMVGHVSVPALDPSNTPASLSRVIVNDLLRHQMTFNGVIVTDDLEMGAIIENYSVGEAAVSAVAAGADMVMVAHTAAQQTEAYEALLAAARSGKIKEDDINKSVLRILEMKKKYRLEL